MSESELERSRRVNARPNPDKERIRELEQVLQSIANEKVELSHDKIKWQVEDHIRWAKEVLNQQCNGFCGEYECKENKQNCKR